MMEVWFEMAGMSGNGCKGWKWLEMAGYGFNDWKCLKLAEISLKWQGWMEVAVNGCECLEMAVNG